MDKLNSWPRNSKDARKIGIASRNVKGSLEEPVAMVKHNSEFINNTYAGYAKLDGNADINKRVPGAINEIRNSGDNTGANSVGARSPKFREVRNPMYRDSQSPVFRDTRSPVFRDTRSPVFRDTRSPGSRDTRSPVSRDGKHATIIRSPKVAGRYFHKTSDNVSAHFSGRDMMNTSSPKVSGHRGSHSMSPTISRQVQSASPNISGVSDGSNSSSPKIGRESDRGSFDEGEKGKHFFLIFYFLYDLLISLIFFQL